MARQRVAARLTAHWLLVALLAFMGLVAPASAGLEKSSSYRREDQITAVNSNIHYRYDGFGQRVQKQVDADTTHYLWNGDEVLKEYTGTGALKADYFLGAGREGIKTGSGWNWYLTDALDSTVLLTDDAGTITAAYDYQPYGKTTQTAGNPALYNPYRWTGQQFDDEAGMYYLRARHYHPRLGRFLARDPIGYAGGSNLYAYCGNDPLNCSDPSGLGPPRAAAVGLEPYNSRALKPVGKEDRRAGLIIGLVNLPAFLPALVQGGQAGLMWARMNPLKAVIAGDATVGAATGMPTGNMLPTGGRSNLSGLRGHVGAAGADDFVRTLQSGGRTLSAGAAKGLNELLEGAPLHRRDWGRALEAMKRDQGLPPSWHDSRIMSDGAVINRTTGEVVGNLLDYLK